MAIDKKKVLSTSKERKVVQVKLRITKSLSKWIAKNKYSPTAIFQEAVKELGYTGE